MSGYFAGLLLVHRLTPRIVQLVGHIRVFAASPRWYRASFFCFPYGSIRCRGSPCASSPGLCTSGLYIVCESWLNSASSNQNRGKMLSIYMIVSYGAMGGGQLLLNVSDGSGFRASSSCRRCCLVAAAAVAGADRDAKPRRHAPGDDCRNLPGFAVGCDRHLRQWACAERLLQHGRRLGLMQGLPLPYVSLMMALPPIAVIVSQYPAGCIVGSL